MLLIQKEPAHSVVLLDERRRPGRTEVRPALIAMLRDPAVGPATIYALPLEPAPDCSKPLLGILLALLLAVPLWVIGVAAGYWLLG